MTKGIRAFSNETFNNTLPQLSELGNIAFRREVMAQIIMAFEVSVASAATHYNHSLKAARESNPADVATLGRAEDKKGGRKPKVQAVVVATVDVIKVKTGEVVAVGVTQEVAEALIIKAVTAHKAKLAIKVNEPAASTELVVAEAVAA